MYQTGMFSKVHKSTVIQWNLEEERKIGTDLTVKWLISSSGNSQRGSWAKIGQLKLNDQWILEMSFIFRRDIKHKDFCQLKDVFTPTGRKTKN